MMLGGSTVAMGHSTPGSSKYVRRGKEKHIVIQTNKNNSPTAIVMKNILRKLLHLCRACDRLRCTSCDFRVIYFDDHIWHSRSDYLFFRNCVPDHKCLKKNLIEKKGKPKNLGT